MQGKCEVLSCCELKLNCETGSVDIFSFYSEESYNVGLFFLNKGENLKWAHKMLWYDCKISTVLIW